MTDILIAVADGLTGVPEAITAVRRAISPLDCLLSLLTSRHHRADPALVHLVRPSLDVISWKDRKAAVPELRAICRAQDAKAGRAALAAFEVGPRATATRVLPGLAAGVYTLAVDGGADAASLVVGDVAAP